MEQWVLLDIFRYMPRYAPVINQMFPKIINYDEALRFITMYGMTNEALKQSVLTDKFDMFKVLVENGVKIQIGLNPRRTSYECEWCKLDMKLCRCNEILRKYVNIIIRQTDIDNILIFNITYFINRYDIGDYLDNPSMTDIVPIENVIKLYYISSLHFSGISIKWGHDFDGICSDDELLQRVKNNVDEIVMKYPKTTKYNIRKILDKFTIPYLRTLYAKIKDYSRRG
jgi:hypothetical protein